MGQINGTRYRYDGAGNLIERQQPNGERLTLGYDGAHRLPRQRTGGYPRSHLPLRRPGKTHQQNRAPHQRHHPLRLGR
ncbi:RHS repeat protein [Vreelandella titanicae]|nr:RHS repeat protein [Halomonas titanicae]